MLHLGINRAAAVGALVLAASLALSGCGRRGALEAPEAARTAPAAAAAQAPAAQTRIAPLGARSTRVDPARRDALSPDASDPADPSEGTIKAPDRPFILDVIL